MLRIEIKDNRYRYILSDLSNEKGLLVPKDMAKGLQKVMKNKMEGIVLQLKESMLKQVIGKW